MRLFVGLRPSDEFRSALSLLQERLRAAGVTGQFLDPSNLHMTLAFIGEWPEEVTEVLPGVEDPFMLNGEKIKVDDILIDGKTCKGNVEIPSDVTMIVDNAFYFCSNLTNIVIPSSVTSIGDYAFLNCSNLKFSEEDQNLKFQYTNILSV